MPIRRALGRGLQAFGAGLGDYYAQQQAQQAIADRQRADDERGAKLALMLEKFKREAAAEAEFDKENPIALAKKLGRSIDPEDAAAPVSKRIADAKNPSEVPTFADIAAENKAGGGRTVGPIEPGSDGLDPTFSRLMHQRLDKERSIETEASKADRVIEETNPDGSKVSKAVNPRTMGDITTGLSAEQMGKNEGVQAVAKAPGTVKATNTVESGTRAEKVKTAGATAAAQGAAGAQARLNVEYDPKNVARQIDFIKQKAITEAAAQGDAEAAKVAKTAADSAAVANMALGQIKAQYDKIKLPGSPAGAVRAAGRNVAYATGTMQFINKDAAKLDRLADQYAMLLYRAYGGTGANVSDNDIKMMKNGIPYSYVIGEIGDEVFRNSASLLSYAAIIKKRYGTAPFEVQMEVGNKWLEQSKKARSAGADEFQDPMDPTKTVPVIK